MKRSSAPKLLINIMDRNLTTLRQDFAAVSNWQARQKLLLHYSKANKPLDDENKIDNNLVGGCEAKVWLTLERKDDHFLIKADSDSRIIRGLLVLLLLALNGLDQQQLADFDLNEYFQSLQLSHFISTSRINGLNSILNFIQSKIIELSNNPL
ncbi:MAG: Fe-S metabolism protein SufE [Gammaproteobacteria bacterium CG22_combo_CG10-13_8_21_14_all_40_8]|nr:MAG: Fe-S metabolism protein SufE [Gammaproteobacteria bacterium CG22_combo_CG10-13_8_21_14_all_40_8]